MQLANANIARIIHASKDAEKMHGFTSRLAPVNALAERSDGFIWRLADETGNGATNLKVLANDPNVIINMSVWRDLDSLYAFTYKTVHSKLIRQRTAWFEPVQGIANLALWWVEDAHQPDIAEAVAKMRQLKRNGPSSEAFTFAMPFSAEGTPVVASFPDKDCA